MSLVVKTDLPEVLYHFRCDDTVIDAVTLTRRGKRVYDLVVIGPWLPDRYRASRDDVFPTSSRVATVYHQSEIREVYLQLVKEYVVSQYV